MLPTHYQGSNYITVTEVDQDLAHPLVSGVLAEGLGQGPQKWAICMAQHHCPHGHAEPGQSWHGTAFVISVTMSHSLCVSPVARKRGVTPRKGDADIDVWGLRTEHNC